MTWLGLGKLMQLSRPVESAGPARSGMTLLQFSPSLRPDLDPGCFHYPSNTSWRRMHVLMGHGLWHITGPAFRPLNGSIGLLVFKNYLFTESNRRANIIGMLVFKNYLFTESNKRANIIGM